MSYVCLQYVCAVCVQCRCMCCIVRVHVHTAHVQYVRERPFHLQSALVVEICCQLHLPHHQGAQQEAHLVVRLAEGSPERLLCCWLLQHPRPATPGRGDQGGAEGHREGAERGGPLCAQEDGHGTN